MGIATHRIREQASHRIVRGEIATGQTAGREIAWTARVRFVLEALARAGTRQPELVPIRVARDPRFR